MAKKGRKSKIFSKMAEDTHFYVAKYTFTPETASLLNIAGIFHAQIFFSHIWQWNRTRTSNPVILSNYRSSVWSVIIKTWVCIIENNERWRIPGENVPEQLD